MSPGVLAEVATTRIRFVASDGFPLGGWLHEPDGRVDHAVVLATGAGIRAERYRHFSNFLARHGVATLAFDYRGVGLSRPARLRGLVAGFEDWAELDAGAALEWTAARYPRATLTGIGHSIGALLIGAPAAAQRLAQLVLIAPHAGHCDDYAPPIRLLVRASFRVAGPPLRSALGYFPARLFRIGEDLPSRVAVQWGAYHGDARPLAAGGSDPARASRLLDQVAALRMPALVLSAPDDGWATEAGVRRLLQAYSSLLVVRRIVAPADLRQRRIGHWGLFRRSAASLAWPIILRFIEPALAR